MNDYLPVVATARGARHRRAGQLAEDAVGSSYAHDVAAVAIADGVSDQRCPHAGRGAQIAVCAALATAAQLRDGMPSAAWLTTELQSTWSAMVRRSAGNPTTPTLEYATTVCVAAATEHAVIVALLGDGEVVCVDEENRLLKPVPDDDRGLCTLAHPDATERWRTATMPRSSTPLRAVFVCTDGVSDLLVEADWDLQLAAQLHDLTANASGRPVVDALDDLAARAAEIGGDDASIGLLFRPDGHR